MNRANGTYCGEPTPRRENRVVPVVPGVVPAKNAIHRGKSGGGSPGSRTGSQNAVVVPRVPPIGGTGNQGPGNQRQWTPPETTKHKHSKHRCGALVLTALDHWACAMTVICDPWPLSPAGEVQALRDDRQTYQIRQWGVRYRNAYRIAGNPPRPGVTVLAEHRCGHPIPDTWKQPLPPLTPRPNNQEVPF
jgi:hypothetical protein